jgi:hypothetical protein
MAKRLNNGQTIEGLTQAVADLSLKNRELSASVSDWRTLAESQAAELGRRDTNDNHRKLTIYDVVRIREEYSQGSWSQRQIAELYDVNPATVSRTVRGIYHQDVV